MKNRIFPFVVLILGIIALFINNVSFIDVCLFTISIIITFQIFVKYPINQHLAKYIVLLTYWISLPFIAGLHIVDSNDIISASSYSITFSFGIRIYFFSTLSWLLFVRITKKKVATYHYLPKRISDSTINLIFIVFFLLSAFSWSIGLSKMGAEAVALPFGLGGIINLSRSMLFPMLFMIIVENRFIRNEKFDKKYYALFFLWSVFEVFVRISKSVLVTNFIYTFLLLYLCYKPNWKTIVKVASPLLVAFLLLYPIIGHMRMASNEGQSFSESIKYATSEVKSSGEDNGNFILTPLNRTFMTADMYIKDLSYIEGKQLFDFSNLPLLLVSGGSIGFQTYIIDGYGDDSHHSSGTTGIMDPLLHGGKGLCYLFVFLMMFSGALIDRLNAKRKYSIYVILVYLLWLYCNEQNITNMYYMLGLQQLFFNLLAIYIAYRLNFRKKIEA